MRRKRFQQAAAAVDVINLSPLMDMVFILLIFFIVTAVFVDDTGVDIKRPELAADQKLERRSIYIGINQGGEVIYSGQIIGLGGIQPVIKRLIRQQLRPVIIEVDEDVSTKCLLAVMDEVKLAGVDSVSVATR